MTPEEQCRLMKELVSELREVSSQWVGWHNTEGKWQQEADGVYLQHQIERLLSQVEIAVTLPETDEAARYWLELAAFRGKRALRK